MAYLQDGYYSGAQTAAQAMPAERAAFIQKTYLHLAGAIAAFIGLEAVLIKSGFGDQMFGALARGGSFGMIALMIGFIGAGYLAQWWANSSTSKAMQYAGLGLYVVVEAIIILPLLMIAQHQTNDLTIIYKAGFLTGGLVVGLTTAVFVTKADFSFMGTVLWVLGWVALATIFASFLFGFGLGMWFSLAMILLASGYLVYDTSNVLHRYGTNQYVAASLQLFASVALLFYYILRFALQQNSRN